MLLSCRRIFFSFIFISWRLITLQHCSGFCHTLKWISHGFTCIPHPSPPTHLSLHPIPLGLPSAPGPSTCLMHPTWAGDLFQENFVCGLRGRILHGLPLTGIPLLSMKSLLHSSPLKLKNLKTFSSVQSLSCVRLFATPWTLHARPPCPLPNSRSLLKLMSIELVMPFNHLIFCCPLLLLPSIFPSIRVFSIESVLHIRCQRIGVSASAWILPMNIQDWFPLGLTGWI